MSAMVSQITSLTIVYWTVNSGADQRKHQSPARRASNAEKLSIYPGLIENTIEYQWRFNYYWITFLSKTKTI